jgi:acetyl-CoA C-acetyltransferase
MSATRPCAVVGVGQTHHKSRRLDVSFGGLVREAVFRALDDAHMTLADIEAVSSARPLTFSRAS